MRSAGGSGEDVFVWRSRTESPHGPDRDTVTDFTRGLDLLDLSGLLPGMAFLDTGGFTGTAGEVRINTAIAGGTVTRLYVDLTGNGASDLSIDLLGAPVITAHDLIL